MKKFLALVLVALMLIACTACGGDENPSGTEIPSSSQSGDNSTDKNPETSGMDEPKQITLSDVLNHKESPAEDFFCNDDGNGGLILVEYLGSAEIVVIPEEINGKHVTKINKYVFSNDSSVAGIKLSNTVSEIAGYAFAQNQKLQYMIGGTGLVTIGESAFQACGSLKEVQLHDGLKTIKTLAFSQCTALASVDIPSSVETIEIIAFNMMADNFKLIGKAGSVAETYATGASIKFEAK